MPHFSNDPLANISSAEYYGTREDRFQHKRGRGMQSEQLGPYRIVKTLGRGGMGTVYEGVNVETGSSAAVKILSAVLGEEEDFRRRFEDEVEALRKLRHPNIVRLLGFGEHDQRLFYAMELVNGRSLEQELLAGRMFDWREVAEIGVATCRALRHAHDRGIIHRDIKPANLLLDSDGQTKLADFGIARLFGGSRLTTPGNVLGTVEYMAPEQAGSQPVGPRADLYSLGGVLFALLTRRPPFLAGSLVEMIEKHCNVIPDPLSRYCPDAPAELGAIIAQLLEKKPQNRVANPTLLARRLEAMLWALPRSSEDQSSTSPGDASKRPERPPSNLATPASDSPAVGRTRSADSWPEVDGEPEFQISVPLGETGTAQPSPADLQTPADDLSSDSEPLEPSVWLPSVDPMGQTRATDAFDEFPSASSSDQTREPADEGETARRFVNVKEEDLDPSEAHDSQHGSMISPQTGLLVAALLAIGLAAWYMLRPPSREVLYGRISATASAGTVDSYRQVEDQIQQFLSRFSGDPRCDRLRGYTMELDLERRERRLETRAALSGGSGALLPIEQIYLEAIRYARIDPELGMAKLEAIVVLYESADRSDEDGSVGFVATEQCVELARRRLERLRKQFEESNVDHEAMITKRLDRADSLDQTDPAAARRIREKVIELYDRKPWASDAVGRAREAIQ